MLGQCQIGLRPSVSTTATNDGDRSDGPLAQPVCPVPAMARALNAGANDPEPCLRLGGHVVSANAEYRVEEQLLGSVDSLLSFWPLVREHPEIGPRQALGVLSTWSHLQRFPPALLDQPIVDRLHEAIQSDA